MYPAFVLIDITNASDADLNALLGLSDDAETIDEAIDLWRDARHSRKPNAEMTIAERAGFFLWASAHGSIDFKVRPAFAQDCARTNGEPAAADFIHSLIA